MARNRCNAGLLGVVLILVVGIGTANSRNNPLSQGQLRILAELDSLHAARAVAAVESTLTTHLEPYRQREDDAFASALRLRRGRLLTSFGRSAQAIPVLAEVVEEAEAQGDSLVLTRAVRWLSVAHGIQGHATEAGELSRRLLAISRARGDELHEGWAHVGLGWQALNRGLLVESREHHERAIRLFAAAEDPGAEIWARNGYAVVLQRQGDYEAALALYLELSDLARRIGNVFVEAMALNNLGSLTQKLGDPGAAIPHYQRARALQSSIHQTREAVIPALNIAVCRIDQGLFDEAAERLAALDRHCLEEGFPDLRADVLYESARVRTAQHRLREAIELHREVERFGEELPVATRVRNVCGLARTLAELDSIDTALELLAEGREHWRNKTAGVERLMLDLAWGERLADAGRSEEALPVLAEVATEAARTGVTGYRVSSRSRGARIHLQEGRSDSALTWLRLAAASWEAERMVPLDPRWREQRGTYGQSVYPRLADLLLRTGSGVVTAHDAVNPFKARTLLEAMLGPGGRANDDPTAEAVPESLLLRLRKEALRPREIFLDYYLGEERSFVFVASRDTIAVARLAPLAEVEEGTRRYRALLDADVDLEGGPASSRMASLVFGALEGLLTSADTIVWSPDGPLHRLPLSTLRLEESLLADSHRILRVPSASALLHLRQRGGNGPPRRSILAVAGTRGARGTRLVGPTREVHNLASTFVEVETHVDPEPERLWTHPAAGILHVAAHATVDPDHPWRSSFLLSEPLSAGEVSRRRLPFDMAVLSSCATMGSQARLGEGQLGVSSAFLAAGIPTVIATLWPVSDSVALEFSRAFYDALAGETTVVDALGRARREMRRHASTARAEDWAAFVLVGDGELRFDLERRRARTGWGFLAAVAVLAGWWWRRRLRARGPARSEEIPDPPDAR